ncbi:hypothetical protein ACVDG3_07755 [Meridianimarinicoccus sp. RP-17]|uniref:hypothetical protein n=1 Tax=Meridianimarinicoccus zhengii TaxID=2056810 RepID=UPI0013A6E47F|nr:hypothetical protein [Phycocomes zhengii]
MSVDEKDTRIAELERGREALIQAIIALRAFRGLPDDVLIEIGRRERAMTGATD